MRIVIDARMVENKSISNKNYESKKLTNLIKQIKQTYIKYKGLKYEGEVSVLITCYFDKNGKTKEIEYLKKPSADNIGKTVLESLKNIAYSNISQVTMLKVIKRFGNKNQIIIQVDRL